LRASHLTAALELEPRQAGIWRDRGLARLKDGQLEAALADLNEAIRLDPADAVSFNNRGVVHLKAGRPAQARVDLEEAVRLDPALPNPQQHLASLPA
jgi:Flp pilus assembly protein TadD